MHSIYFTLITLFPTLISLGLALCVFLNQRNRSIGLFFFLMGAALCTAPVVITTLIYVSLKFQITPFSTAWVLTVTTGAIAIALVTIYCENTENIIRASPSTQSRHVTFSLPSLTRLSAILGGGVYFGVILFFSAHEMLINPIMAWDAIRPWALQASMQIEMATNSSPQLIGEKNHPLFLPLLLAWDGFWISQTSTKYAPSFSWLSLYLGLILTLFGIAFMHTRKIVFSTLVTMIWIASPIMETQMSLIGYADLWLASLILLSIATLIHLLSKKQKKLNLQIMGSVCILLVTIPFIKNGAWIYSALIFFSMLSTLALTSESRVAKLAWILCVLGITFATLRGFSVDFYFFDATFSLSEDSIQVGSRTSSTTGGSIRDISINSFYAWFVSSSFGPAFSGLLVFLPLSIAYSIMHKSRPILFTSTLSLLAIMVALFGQKFSEYFFSFSQIDSDTGLTRFSISIHLMLAMVLITLISKQRAKV